MLYLCVGDSLDTLNISTGYVSLDRTQQSAMKGCLEPFFFGESGNFIPWLQNSGHVLSRRGIGGEGLRKSRTKVGEGLFGRINDVEEDSSIEFREGLVVEDLFVGSKDGEED